MKKLCRKCGIEKILEDYYPHKNCADGHEGTCKKCRIEMAKNYLKDNKEKIVAYGKAYYQDNKKTKDAMSKKWHRENKEYQINYRTINKDKISKNAKDWRSKNRESYISEFRKRKYGITQEQYLHMLKNQNGVCAICGNLETVTDKKTGLIRSLCVDHDHESGKIRGLLCSRCNVAIGLIDDSPEKAKKIFEYLSYHTNFELPEGG
jgi:hypothetical protein